jgi:hypothetical protein
MCILTVFNLKSLGNRSFANDYLLKIISKEFFKFIFLFFCGQPI